MFYLLYAMRVCNQVYHSKIALHKYGMVSWKYIYGSYVRK